METKLNNDTYNSIFKDYTNKLNIKFNTAKSADINNMVCLMNWCFLFKNNFFVTNFNSKYIKNVCDTYNTLKTNILVSNNQDIFVNIKVSELKRLKFILQNYIQNYQEIKNNSENKLLCDLIPVDSIKNCIFIINDKINNLNQSIIKNI